MLTPPIKIVLSEAERVLIQDLVNGIITERIDLRPASFALSARQYADELPRNVRCQVYDFIVREEKPAIIISGNPLFQSLERLTPTQIPEGLNDLPLSCDEILHFLYSSLFGGVFTWNSIQKGNLVNYVLPLEAHRSLSISSGSDNPFDLHTEDAFSPYAGEYLGLYCIRNEERAAAILSYVGDAEINDRVLEELFKKKYVISPNVVHDLASKDSLEAILFGSRKTPYIRANFNIPQPDMVEEKNKACLRDLMEALTVNSQKIVLTRNEAIYIDNYRCLHGREAFMPNYDGAGRWLKRLYISSSVRQTRGLRQTALSRTIEV